MDYDSRDMLVSSDYPLDKVVYMHSGSGSAPASGFITIDTPHELPFRPMVLTTWSTDPGFSTSYDAGFPQYGDFTQPYLESSSTYEFVRTVITAGNSATTLYWRSYGFMPPDVNEVAPFTSATADSFVINTDYNYTKLFLAGRVDISSGSVFVPHNLGYRPQVEIWGESIGDSDFLVKHNYGATVEDGLANRITATSTDLEFNKGIQPGIQNIYYYRIYTDEQ